VGGGGVAVGVASGEICVAEGTAVPSGDAGDSVAGVTSERGASGVVVGALQARIPATSPMQARNSGAPLFLIGVLRSARQRNDSHNLARKVTSTLSLSKGAGLAKLSSFDRLRMTILRQAQDDYPSTGSG
jgi:hypothetical protein